MRRDAINGLEAPRLEVRPRIVAVDHRSGDVGLGKIIVQLGRRKSVGRECQERRRIGFPPKGDDPGPAFYFSGDAAPDLKGLADYGLDIRIVDGPIGAALALKLSYAGITKELVAIATAMVLAAERAGAGAALKAELAASQPQLLARFAKTLPDMYPKAYRWVEEMHAISEFIGDEFPEAQIYKGAAGLYERIAADVAGDHDACKRIDAFLAS
ncbi:DUF1932 domain-containing protein [Bradyrhizobium genosp. A]|uniref:DUF1932 domain-containing protein n=1 Tax=Bradyrhizobium genosp. A TaxID=83626 RepID=UPI003CFA3E56